jgi:hypothetical protein
MGTSSASRKPCDTRVRRKLTVAVLLTFTATACASRALHVRGELDRSTWLVRNCAPSESYRVMMTSNQASDFLQVEKELGMSGSDLLILEFDGVILPPKFPWNAHETVGVSGPMSVERGTCSASHSDETTTHAR